MKVQHNSAYLLYSPEIRENVIFERLKILRYLRKDYAHTFYLYNLLSDVTFNFTETKFLVKFNYLKSLTYLIDRI